MRLAVRTAGPLLRPGALAVVLDVFLAAPFPRALVDRHFESGALFQGSAPRRAEVDQELTVRLDRPSGVDMTAAYVAVGDLGSVRPLHPLAVGDPAFRDLRVDLGNALEVEDGRRVVAARIMTERATRSSGSSKRETSHEPHRNVTLPTRDP